MAEGSERVRTTPDGPILPVRLTEPLSDLVASVQVLRSIGVTPSHRDRRPRAGRTRTTTRRRRVNT